MWVLHTSLTLQQSLKQQLAIDHFPAIGHFSTNLPHLAKQIRFARPYLLYIFNKETIDNLLQCSCFQLRNGRSISNCYFRLCYKGSTYQKVIFLWSQNVSIALPWVPTELFCRLCASFTNCRISVACIVYYIGITTLAMHCIAVIGIT